MNRTYKVREHLGDNWPGYLSAVVVIAVVYFANGWQNNLNARQFDAWHALHPDSAITLQQFVLARDGHFLPKD